MKQAYSYPPNIDEIKKHLDIEGKRGIIFTYGDTIYNPDRGEIDAPLLHHETTHTLQQEKMGIDTWWRKYLTDQNFRLSQELEAYQNQYYQYCLDVKDRNRRAVFLFRIASDLASKQYGNIISIQEARKLISQ